MKLFCIYMSDLYVWFLTRLTITIFKAYLPNFSSIIQTVPKLQEFLRLYSLEGRTAAAEKRLLLKLNKLTSFMSSVASCSQTERNLILPLTWRTNSFTETVRGCSRSWPSRSSSPVFDLEVSRPAAGVTVVVGVVLDAKTKLTWDGVSAKTRGVSG